ncbi:MAG: type I DNA topoisomerase, partial [Lentisphaerae bacterium]
MKKNLVIVESPRKANTINKILGKEYNIVASMGHVRDLPEKGLSVDIEHDFKPEYEIIPSRRKVIQKLQQAVKAAEGVYLAPDPDREGEAIAWHLYEILHKKNKNARFHRVTFHEITRSAIQQAFAHVGQINMALVNAQQARRILDRIVGYQTSDLVRRQIANASSAGRVQSVALRIICERQDEIDNFKPEEYWLIDAIFQEPPDGPQFPMRLVAIDDEKVKIGSEKLCLEYCSDIRQGVYQVTLVTTKPGLRRPKPPFITSTLQQAASSNLSMSPAQTMRVAQQLYEGVEGAEHLGGLITYMRTDSVNVAKEAQEAAREFISAHFGREFVPGKPNVYRSRNTAQEA